MTPLQVVLLDTFKELIKFFEANNIPYFACGGTALGAIRHKGFIPWDDDIDIYVLRKDYDRMIELRHTIDESKNKLMCIDDFPFHYSYARFYNQEYELPSVWDALFHQGPFIDIFPIDEADDDIQITKRLEKEYISNAHNYRRCLFHKPYTCILKTFLKGNFKTAGALLYRNICFPISKKDKYLQAFHEAEKKIKNVRGKYKFSYFHSYAIEKELFPKEFFEDYVEVPFETINIRVTAKHHEYLTQFFGDYMQLPPVEKRITHCDARLLKKIN